MLSFLVPVGKNGSTGTVVQPAAGPFFIAGTTGGKTISEKDGGEVGYSYLNPGLSVFVFHRLRFSDIRMSRAD